MSGDERLFAHSLPGRPLDEWESLPDHGVAVARLSARAAARFGWEAVAAAAALLHDAGKASVEFQLYIRGERSRGGDHSTWGARLSERLYGAQPGRILAHCIAGHHAGLSDNEDLRRRLDPTRTTIPNADRWARTITPPTRATLRPTRSLRLPASDRHASFGQAFLIRMLFSCLVDADCLATERFKSGGAVARGVDVEFGALRERLQTHLKTLRAAAKRNVLNTLRAEILDHATGKSDEDPGFFTLTVPTGGGKTLTSLAFALDHACRRNKRRIVYVAPFTAIIEQTAAIFRDVLGDEVVLEHHSSFDWEAAEKRADRDDGDDHDGLGPLRRAAENWDAPVIVTTAVQFFESLFANRTSRCRKLHNLVDSVIILDEAQTLPTNLLLPCLAALEELKTNYGATIVLCTATQPAVRRQDTTLIDDNGTNHGLPIEEERELAPRPRELHKEIPRIRVEILSGTTADDVVAERFAAQPQMLCIVGSRAHARALFERIEDLDGSFHLTTCMCPAHRRGVLANLRERLSAGSPVRLVATSLIEAGVDISFPEVWRARAGVDQIAQAAGRCNREGELSPTLGRVVVFEPADHKPPRALTAARQAAAGVLRDHGDDPLGFDAVAAYFRHLYFQKGIEALDGALVEETPGILAALRRNANGFGFPFRSIADAFRMIDETMTPVVVPWNEEAETVLKRIGAPEREPRRQDLRRLQQFTVNIPRKARDEWLGSGVIRQVRAAYGDALLQFEDCSLYRPRTGIDLGHRTYREAESNVF